MLVLSRLRGQSIRIGPDITVTVTDFRGDKVRLGVSAPGDVKVFRSEIYDQVKQSNVESTEMKPKDLENLPAKETLPEPIKLSDKVDSEESEEHKASDRNQSDMSSFLMTETKRGVYLAHNCVVTGDVKVGEGSSLWFGAVVRGDVAQVVLGKRVNVQDNAVVHCDSGVENVIGDDVVIGHGAVVHGAAVGDGTLIGMGAVVLGRSKIGKKCLIAAGAVVPPGLEVPDGMVVMGVPGKIARPVKPQEYEYMAWLAGHYVQMAKRHCLGEILSAKDQL